MVLLQSDVNIWRFCVPRVRSPAGSLWWCPTSFLSTSPHWRRPTTSTRNTPEMSSWGSVCVSLDLPVCLSVCLFHSLVIGLAACLTPSPLHFKCYILDKAPFIVCYISREICFQVPMGGEERMKSFPPLVPQDFTLKGLGFHQAMADIKMSSLGDPTQP